MNVKVWLEIGEVLEIIQGHPIVANVGNRSCGRRRYLPKLYVLSVSGQSRARN